MFRLQSRSFFCIEIIDFFFIFKPLPFGRPRSVLTFQGDFWNLQAKPVHPVHDSTTYTTSGAHKNAPYGTAAAKRTFPSRSFSVLNPPQHEPPSISDGNIKARVGSSSLLIGQIVWFWSPEGQVHKTNLSFSCFDFKVGHFLASKLSTFFSFLNLCHLAVRGPFWLFKVIFGIYRPNPFILCMFQRPTPPLEPIKTHCTVRRPRYALFRQTLLVCWTHLNMSTRPFPTEILKPALVPAHC